MRFLTWSLSALLLVSIATNAFSEEQLRLGINEMPPYLSQNLPHYGFLGRIITEIFASEGITVEYVVVPWKRALVEVKRGALDGTPGWYRTPEREKDYYITAALIDDNQTFFHLKTSLFDWKSIDDLHGIRIGATLGYNYGDKFAQAEQHGKIDVDRIASDEQNFKKLLAGRIDIFPMNTVPGYSMLQTMFKPDVVDLFTNHPQPLRSETLHLLLSKRIKRNERLLTLFNNGLKKLRDSGKYDQYLKEIQKSY